MALQNKGSSGITDFSIDKIITGSEPRPSSGQTTKVPNIEDILHRLSTSPASLLQPSPLFPRTGEGSEFSSVFPEPHDGLNDVVGQEDADDTAILSSHATDGGVTVKLGDAELWRKFHRIGTEMIINRFGRRMFPSVSIDVTGLDPNAYYSLILDIIPADRLRYKFIENRWMPVGKADPEPDSEPFVHSDSPSTGSYWMSSNVSFAKLKITNNKDKKAGKIILHSMHKYMVQVRIINMKKKDEAPSEATFTFAFPLTSFVAVTAYQNDQITQMKIRNNPFAKAFRDAEVASILARCESKKCQGSELGSEYTISGSDARSTMSHNIDSIGKGRWQAKQRRNETLPYSIPMPLPAGPYGPLFNATMWQRMMMCNPYPGIMTPTLGFPLMGAPTNQFSDDEDKTDD